MKNRVLYSLAVMAIAMLTGNASAAEGFPQKPIKLVVPAAVGGSTDLGARLVADLLGKALKTTVIVENKGGGGGRIGANTVNHAKPDGYTILYGNSITNALLPALASKVDYDPLNSFEPIGQIFEYPTLIVCGKATPYNTLAEFISYAKAHPKKVTIATAGNGSGNHFSSVLLNSKAGIETLHVPYRGNSLAVQDILGGFADCIHMTEAKAYIDSGDLKVLATTGARRDPRFPDVPTVQESGIADYDVTWWQALFAPKGTPSDVVETLSRALEQVAQAPELKSKTFDIGFVPEYKSPSGVVQAIKDNMKVFSDTAKKAHISID